MSETAFTLELRQQADYRFEVRFDNPALPVLVTDETFAAERPTAVAESP